ncbi:MAG TPA: hypothetical protein VHA13_05970, partial [Gammaproteobacteria bacterium]|nr:hypothetical protein [Gammaproteobacteria bacterium]
AAIIHVNNISAHPVWITVYGTNNSNLASWCSFPKTREDKTINQNIGTIQGEVKASNQRDCSNRRNVRTHPVRVRTLCEGYAVTIQNSNSFNVAPTFDWINCNRRW